MKLIIETAVETVEHVVTDEQAARSTIERLRHTMEPIDAKLIIDGVEHVYDFEQRQFTNVRNPLP